jgi:hypothetical protein
VKKKSTRISLDTLRFHWRVKFRQAVAIFDETGTLPPEARGRLVGQISFAVLDAVLSHGTKLIAPPPNEVAAGADNIARKARQLRTGLSPKQRERLLAETQRMGVDAKEAAEWLASLRASNIDATLFARLLDLEHIAEKIALEQRQRLRSRHSRNVGKQPLEALLHALFDTYAEARSQHPDTGPGISVNNRLVMFVGAVLKAAKVNPGADDKHLREAVRGAFQRWRKSRSATQAQDSAS